MGGNHARLRKPRPGASQRHAATALPVLSVSHTLFPNTNQVISLTPFAVTVRLTPLLEQTFDSLIRHRLVADNAFYITWDICAELYLLFGQMVPEEVSGQCWMLANREGSI